MRAKRRVLRSILALGIVAAAAGALPAPSAGAATQGPSATTYISLNKLLGEVRAATEAKRELPDALRYLSGIAQLRYVFVFPEDHDLVLAGTSEPFDATNKLQPIGKLTGRPVMHLDDLVTALRSA